MITFLAPASRCLAASARAVKKPVDSITTSTPSGCSPSAAGSRSESTLSGAPSTEIVSPSTPTSPGKRPRIESYLSRLASVPGSVRSLTATNSISAPAAWAARKTLRPIRPKPLMPTFTAMKSSPPEFALGVVRSYGPEGLVGRDRGLDLAPGGVLADPGVGAGAGRAALARVADVDAAGFHAVLPGRLDGDDS